MFSEITSGILQKGHNYILGREERIPAEDFEHAANLIHHRLLAAKTLAFGGISLVQSLVQQYFKPFRQTYSNLSIDKH